MLTKNIMKHMLFCALTIVLFIPALSRSSQAAEESLLIELASNTIQISTFYNGTTLDVTGSVPADTDVVVQVSGTKQDVHLKEKGKVAGFLWMNKSDVSLENTPTVYMVYTPAGLKENFLSPELNIGYKALVNDISIIPESEDKAFVFGEYVKLMEESGVYSIHEAAVTYEAPNNGVKRFSATLTIPSKMSAGDYMVKAIGIKDGVVTSQAQEPLSLELSGLPAAIASLAYGRPLLYGIMAVLIAISAGLIIGVIFRGGGGAH